jgi:hypothetical protein
MSPFPPVYDFYGFNGFRLSPQKTSTGDAGRIRHAYHILKFDSHDRALQPSMRRFLIGLKKDYQHPNKVDAPNWDRLADRVTTCKTLFLRINGQPKPSFYVDSNSMAPLYCQTPARKSKELHSTPLDYFKKAGPRQCMATLNLKALKT